MKSRFINSRNLSANNLGLVAGSVPSADGDPYWESVSLLLKGDGPSGGTNNNFVDTGPYSLAITKNGVVGTSSNSPLAPPPTSGIQYSPAAHGGSIWLNGTASDYLGIAYNSAALELGNSDFTLECWIYAPTPATANQGIFAGAADFHYGLILSGSKIGFLASTNGSNWDINGTLGTATIAANTWYHIAATRSGSTWRTFVNGVQDSTWTSSATVVSRNEEFRIGRWGNNAPLAVGSQISGLRLVKGTALYTGNFTVPTAAPVSITNTTLLCNFTSFAVYDSRCVAKGIETRGNSATMVAQSKYGGSSIYFDGAGDTILIRPTPELSLGAGDFTIETWYYPINATASEVLLDIYDSDSAGRFILRTWGTNGISIAGQAGGAIGNTGSMATANQWNHVAVVRASGVIYIFINGISSGAAIANTTNFTLTTTYAVIGAYASDLGTGSFKGYLDDYRITKGVARYTGNFTPLNKPFPPFYKVQQSDPYWSSVSFLTHADGTNNKNNRILIDETGGNSFVAVNSGSPAQGSYSPFSANTKWDAAMHGGSGYYDGTTDCTHRLDQVNSTNAFADFGNGSFTVETWFLLPVLPGARRSLFSLNHDGLGYATIIANITSNNKIGLSLQEGAGGWKHDDTATGLGSVLVANQWYHLAIERTVGSANVNVYLDGGLIGSYALTSASTVLGQWETARRTYIGAYNTTNLCNCYLSSMRVVKGSNVYGGAFTRPTSPAKIVTNTTLLLNFANAAIWDEKARSVLNTVADSKSMTTVPRFGSSSIAFDGTGDWVSGYRPDGYVDAGGDFTFECWYYQLSRGTSQYGDGFITLWKDVVTPGTGLSTTNPGITLRFNGSANETPNLAFYTGSTFHVNMNMAGTTALNVWNHIAGVKHGNKVRMFVNGVMVGETTVSGVTSTTFKCLIIGAAPDGSASEFHGYIDEVRVTKGVARYTNNFVVPTTSFFDY